MKPNRRITGLFAAILAVAMICSILLLGPLDGARIRSSEDDLLYVPSPRTAKVLSLGYTGLSADLYWTRAVQYFGRRHQAGTTDYKQLYPLLDVTTRLDPNLLAAYQFGAVFLSQPIPDGAGQPQKAVELVERGIRENPGEWRLYYMLGFIYYDREDYASAQKAFERGSKVPNANPALAQLAAATAQAAGNRSTARLLWTKIYESAEDTTVRSNALHRLVAMDIQDQIEQLEKLVAEFRQQNGRFPSNFEEMAAAGWLRSVPVDPTGYRYKLKSDGRVEAQNPEILPFLRGLPRIPGSSNQQGS